MGNNICQCKAFCQNQKETNLSSTNLSKNYFDLLEKQKDKNMTNKNSDLLESYKKINIIYINNYLKKITKAYLQYKKNKNKIEKIKIKNINKKFSYSNNKKEDQKNNYLELEEIDNFIEYSMNNPFYIDKVHSSKTSYEKFDIPKINNGKSLEALNRNPTDSQIKIIYHKKYKHKKSKNKLKSNSNLSTKY